MFKVGLKLWNTNINDYLPLVYDLLEENIFDYIELYVVPGYTDWIPLWREVPVTYDIHAPHSAHGVDLSNNSLRHSNSSAYEEVKKYADNLNARYVICHGGVGGDIEECARQLKSIADQRFLLENKPYKPLKFISGGRYTGCNFEEINYIIDKANIGFCLDVGHSICAANSYHKEIYSFVEELFSLHPAKIHLSDIDVGSELDQHLNFGNGNLNYKKLDSIVNLTASDITIETSKNSKTNLDDFVRDVFFLRKLVNE